MNLVNDPQARVIVCGMLAVLMLASVIGFIMRLKLSGDRHKDLVDNLNARIQAWWVMVVTFFIAILCGRITAIILFALVSFLALREFITLTPTKRGDHSVLFWVFFVITPIQYCLLGIKWVAFFLIFIPVYAYLFVPIRNAIAGDTARFLERTAAIQWGLMVCVYFVSYAPALLDLDVPGYVGQGAKLLCFFVFVVQVSDVLQYVFGKLFGKHKISPLVSPNKTVEGFVGGIGASVALGAALYWMTPFNPWQAALMSLSVTLMGFAGGLVMSAIKRDRGVKDYGTLLPGHGGMMDRIDSLCFAAPIFYHLTRYFFVH
jgi:phosphatidate cytidylyltransferase